MISRHTRRSIHQIADPERQPIQGYPNSFMVKVKSQGEAHRLYNTGLLNKDIVIVCKANPFDWYAITFAVHIL